MNKDKEHVPSLKELHRLLRRSGWTIVHRRTHYIATRGDKRVVLSSSPSDHRALKNILALLRRE